MTNIFTGESAIGYEGNTDDGDKSETDTTNSDHECSNKSNVDSPIVSRIKPKPLDQVNRTVLNFTLAHVNVNGWNKNNCKLRQMILLDCYTVRFTA